MTQAAELALALAYVACARITAFDHQVFDPVLDLSVLKDYEVSSNA